MQPSNTIAAASLALLTVLQLWSSTAQADIYKWVDKDGRTHFTDEPPANKGTKVELDVVQPSATPDAGEIRRLELLKQARLEREHNSAIKNNPQSSEPTATRSADRRCTPARHRWYALTQEIPVYWTDNGKIRAAWHGDTYAGARSYIDDSERPGLLAKALREIEAYCPNGDVDEADDSGYDNWLRAEDCAVARSKLVQAEKKTSRATKDTLARLRKDVGEWCD